MAPLKEKAENKTYNLYISMCMYVALASSTHSLDHCCNVVWQFENLRNGFRRFPNTLSAPTTMLATIHNSSGLLFNFPTFHWSATSWTLIITVIFTASVILQKLVFRVVYFSQDKLQPYFRSRNAWCPMDTVQVHPYLIIFS